MNASIGTRFLVLTGVQDYSNLSHNGEKCNANQFLSLPFLLTEKQICAKIANGLTLKGEVRHINECEQLKHGLETRIF